MTRYRTWCLVLAAITLCASPAPALDTEEGGSSPSVYTGNADEGTQIERQAVAQFQEHQYVEAARLFARAWEAYQHPRYQYNIGQCYRHGQRWDQAVAAYGRRLELQPAPNNFIHAHIGYCHLQARRREDANQAFRRYLELEPDGDVAVQVRQALETGLWPEEGRRPPEAVQQARQIHDRADQLVAQGEFQQAAEVYMEGYRQNGQIHELLLNAALCSTWAGRTDEAIERLTQYLRTSGADVGALAHLAECHASQGDLPVARDTYQRYLRQAPSGEFAQEARQFLRFVGRLEPMPTRANMAEAKAHIDRANTHAQAGRYRRALPEYQAAYEIVPVPAVRFNIGLCHYYGRRYEEALGHFTYYLQQSGDEGRYASTHLNIAKCLADLDRNEEAMQHIRAYRGRADAAELPREEHFRSWATEIEDQCKEDD